MLIEGNTLLKIYDEDIIYGVFIAPDHVFYIGNDFDCDDVVKMILPNVKEIGYNFLFYNKRLTYLEMPKVNKIGNNFLYKNTIIENIYMPNIKEIGYNCLVYNCKLQYTHEIVKALKGYMYIGDKKIDKNEYLRKLKIQKLLCE